MLNDSHFLINTGRVLDASSWIKYTNKQPNVSLHFHANCPLRSIVRLTWACDIWGQICPKIASEHQRVFEILGISHQWAGPLMYQYSWVHAECCHTSSVDVVIFLFLLLESCKLACYCSEGVRTGVPLVQLVVRWKILHTIVNRDVHLRRELYISALHVTLLKVWDD